MMWGGAQFKCVIYFYDKSIDKIQKVGSTKSKERMSGKKTIHFFPFPLLPDALFFSSAPCFFNVKFFPTSFLGFKSG